jgi:hypothetical protein
MLIRIRQRLAADDGISLVELLVSMVILSVVLMGLLSTSIASVAAVRTSEQRIRATALVNELLENAQAIPFNQLTFHSGDTFPPGPAPAGRVIDYSATRPPRAPLPMDDVTRDGVLYEITHEIVWVDNPLTGGDEDYKRITVTVSWNGGERSQTAEALRANELIQNEFVLTSLNVSPSLVYMDEDGNVTTPIEMTATTTATPTSGFVEVEYTNRDGIDVTSYLSSIDGQAFNGAVSGGTTFKNGDTLFTFTAERGGETVEGEKLVRFLQPLAIIMAFTPESASICAEETAYAPEVLVTIHVAGSVAEDEVTVTWPGGTGPAEHNGDVDDAGASFTFTIPEGSYTETMTVSVDVNRLSDLATHSTQRTFTLDRPECE